MPLTSPKIFVPPADSLKYTFEVLDLKDLFQQFGTTRWIWSFRNWATRGKIPLYATLYN